MASRPPPWARCSPGHCERPHTSGKTQFQAAAPQGPTRVQAGRPAGAAAPKGVVACQGLTPGPQNWALGAGPRPDVRVWWGPCHPSSPRQKKPPDAYAFLDTKKSLS